MKIAVNTRLLIKDKLEGIGWFTYETLKRITAQHKEHEFVFIFDRAFSDEFIFSENIKPVVTGPQARHPLLYYTWFEFSVPRVLKKHQPDIFLSPDGYLSLSTDVKSLAVIHDLNFEHHPADLPFLDRKYYRHYFPRFAKKAARIATVSEYSKNDIINTYKVDAGKIDVVYNGANEAYQPIAADKQALARAKYSKGKPYFLFVGALHPRKNLVNLFRAFDEYKTSSTNEMQLLVTGAKKWWTTEMRNTFEQMAHKDEVIFTGRLGQGELHKVIASALALTFVSYFEGFGIPILEAMYCDVPVITSNLTSMPEVAGDAALLVDPFSVDEIKKAMQRVSTDEKLRKDLIEKGRIQRQRFTWQQSADKLWESIEKAIDNAQ